MDYKFCNRENAKYTCIFCENRVCNASAVSVDESQERYGEQNYQVEKCPNGACEHLKDTIKVKDVVTQNIKRNGKIFGSLLGHGMFGFQ